MDFLTEMSRYFALQEQYAKLYRRYLVRGVNITLNPNDTEFAPGTPLDAYLGAGVDALRIIITVLIGNLREPPKSILDFPSGSGRVTRHMKAFFPQAKVVASDLYERHLKFCTDELGVEGILSRENFDEIDFGRDFDLICCVSLLTHLPEDGFRSAMRLLSRSLSEAGIAIVSLHGRHSEYVQKNVWKYVDDELFNVVKEALLKKGFGYVDYNDEVRSSVFNKQVHYGISLSRPHWTLKLAEEDHRIRILGYVERGLHAHQDVLVLGRPGINEQELSRNAVPADAGPGATTLPKQPALENDGQIARLSQQTNAIQQNLDAAEARLAAVLNSTSWRMTAPLRRIVTALRGR